MTAPVWGTCLPADADTRVFGPRPPAPVRTGPPAPGRPGWRRVAAVVAIVVLASTGVGAAVTRQSSSAGPETAAAPRPAAAWPAVLRGLDLTRSAAFSTGRVELLADVYLPTCRCLSVDRAALEAIRRRGHRVRGLRLDVVSVRELRREGGAVVLRVVDRIPAFTIVDIAGTVVATDPGRDLRTWDLSLVPTAGGWRITAVSAK